jgi:hypothetical protein
MVVKLVASEVCSGCCAECTRRFISPVCVGSGTASANAGVAGVASDGVASANAGVAGVASDGVASASAGVAGAASDGVANGSDSGVLGSGRRLGSGPGRPAADGRMGFGTRRAGIGNKGAIPCMGGCWWLGAAGSAPTGGCSLEAAGNDSAVCPRDAEVIKGGNWHWAYRIASNI